MKLFTVCHFGMIGIYLKNNPLTPFVKGESEGFPTRFACGNDNLIDIYLPEQ
jgi:hypothetical protein